MLVINYNTCYILLRKLLTNYQCSYVGVKLKIIISYILIFTAISCDSLPSWDDGTVFSSTMTSYQSVVNVTCDRNNTFPGTDAAFIVSTCNTYGQWTPEIKSCIGKQSVYSCIFARCMRRQFYMLRCIEHEIQPHISVVFN